MKKTTVKGHHKYNTSNLSYERYIAQEWKTDIYIPQFYVPPVKPFTGWQQWGALLYWRLSEIKRESVARAYHSSVIRKSHQYLRLISTGKVYFFILILSPPPPAVSVLIAQCVLVYAFINENTCYRRKKCQVSISIVKRNQNLSVSCLLQIDIYL